MTRPPIVITDSLSQYAPLRLCRIICEHLNLLFAYFLKGHRIHLITTDNESVANVRDYIRGIIRFAGVTIVGRERNIGLASSIIARRLSDLLLK